MPGSHTGITFTNDLRTDALLANQNLLNGAGLALGDYDGDGWCDIFLCSLSGSSRLYRNLGGWKFQDVTEAAGLANSNSLARGAVFADGEGHITEAMVGAFDELAKDIQGFYFGRFDVRFADLEDLKRGEKNFTIIEYNGASSEPTHVRDPRTPALKVWRDFMEHWRYAYEVGAEQYARGARALPFWEIVRILRAETALVTQYPDEE